MAATGKENVYLEMDSAHRPDEHTAYSHSVGRSSTATAATNQSGLQECTQRAANKQQSTEDAVMVSHKLLLIIAVFVGLSFLATVVTMIFTLMKTENASPPSGDIAACPGGNHLLSEIREEIKALKENLTGSPRGNGFLFENKQQLTEIKDKIKALRENLTGGPGGNGILFELKTQLSEIKEGFRALKVHRNCADVYKSGQTISGQYKINPDGLGEFQVYCDQNTTGGGWTVFQKTYDGSVDFYRGWDDYKRGFGYLNGEFWLGLDNIYRLTANRNKRLRIDLQRFNATAFAEYDVFAVENEAAKYNLSVEGYSGTAGDGLTYHRYEAFSTKDRDNDKWSLNCALDFSGAWWYKYCCASNLNGLYVNGAGNNTAMVWYKWPYYDVLNHPSLTRSEMKIRPKDF